MMSLLYSSEAPATVCPFPVWSNITGELGPIEEDPRTEALRRYSYGIVLPAICLLGIVGNVLNLVVLTRRNMRGTAYIYMRGYSAAALLAILFAIPFALRVLIHKETGRWNNFPQAFYHAHLELFLGNGCLGVGVMMLLALTAERYVAVCRPGGHQQRPALGPPKLVAAAVIPVATFALYAPSTLRAEITTCVLPDSIHFSTDVDGIETGSGIRPVHIIYQKRDNVAFLNTVFYSVYKIVLEVVFKVAPTILLAGLNLRIMIVYRRSCDRRRRMTLSRTTSASGDEDPRKFAEERRLVLLLGSTSILFLVCVSPMVILNVTLSEDNLTLYSYQVFRALANLLEVTNYSITFYIYCLFSEDFRNTLIRTLQWPWVGASAGYQRRPNVAQHKIPPGPPTATTTPPPTMTTALAANHVAGISLERVSRSPCGSSFGTGSPATKAAARRGVGAADDDDDPGGSAHEKLRRVGYGSCLVRSSGDDVDDKHNASRKLLTLETTAVHDNNNSQTPKCSV